MSSAFRCIQGCGESFFRVYDDKYRLVMTANVSSHQCRCGVHPVSVIWNADDVSTDTPQFDAMIQAVRHRAAFGPLLQAA